MKMSMQNSSRVLAGKKPIKGWKKESVNETSWILSPGKKNNKKSNTKKQTNQNSNFSLDEEFSIQNSAHIVIIFVVIILVSHLQRTLSKYKDTLP